MQTTHLKTAQLGGTGLEITRVRSPEQVDPLIDAANLELSDQDITTIEGGR